MGYGPEAERTGPHATHTWWYRGMTSDNDASVEYSSLRALGDIALLWICLLAVLGTLAGLLSVVVGATDGASVSEALIKGLLAGVSLAGVTLLLLATYERIVARRKCRRSQEG